MTDADTRPQRRSPSGPLLTTYDVPLRPDLIIRMTLPVDLTEGDADRLAAFFRGLAFPEQPGPSANPRQEAS